MSAEGLAIDDERAPGARLGLFLRGPIPWAWLALCARLPGRALHVGVALWLESGLARSRVVKLRPKHLRTLGVDRYAAARALRRMEAAVLVGVVRAPGRAPVVTLLDLPQEGR